jgi:hypothetical protein
MLRQVCPESSRSAKVAELRTDGPETPFSVKTRSGLNEMILWDKCLICSSSISSTRFQSASFEISMLVCDSPFLYSSGQSNNRIRGFSMRRRMAGWVTSLLSMMPFKTRESSISPPGTFSTRAYRLMSTSFRPFSSLETVRMACKASWHMRSDHLETNLVPIEVLIKASISVSLDTSTGMEIESMISSAATSAFLKARMMRTGWMLRSM